MNAPTARILRGLAAILLTLPAFGAEPGPPRGTERSTLEEINRLRTERNLEPLQLSRELSALAQENADRIAETGDPDGATHSGERLLGAARAAGYRAASISLDVASGDADPATAIAGWRDGAGFVWRDILDRSHRDLGVGAAVRSDALVYVLLFAVDVDEDFRRRTAELRDLARVRKLLLDAVNRERAARNLPRLRPHRALELAAQRHADDMLARGYYGHASPEGTLAMDRVRREGYRAERVGENIAKGQDSVGQVMAGWMASREHRDNILGPRFLDAGFGLAFGTTPDGGQVLWVQVFGRERP